MRFEYKPFINRRRFGVEIELDPCLHISQIGEILYRHEYATTQKEVKVESGSNLWAESKYNNFWHVKYDSSCGPTGNKKNGGGWEVASYIAQGSDQIDAIAKAAVVLAEHGAKVNTHCGLHVHVEVKDFSVSQMGILLANWVRIEPLIFQSCPSYRRRNKHCKPLRKKINSMQKMLAKDFYYSIAPVHLHTHENRDKKYTINLVGYAKSIIMDDHSRVTAELRLPESSLSFSDVVGWTTLFVNFVDSCSKNHLMPNTFEPANLAEMMQILSLSGSDNFYILDEKMFSVKNWFLERLIRYATLPGLVSQSRKMLDFISKF